MKRNVESNRMMNSNVLRHIINPEMQLKQLRSFNENMGAVRQTSPSISYWGDDPFLWDDQRTPLGKSSGTVKLESNAFWEWPLWIEVMWNEAWIDANFCRLCIRLNRSMALSLRRNGKCEFSTLLFAHRSVTCLSEHPNSFVAALYDLSLSVTILSGDP